MKGDAEPDIDSFCDDAGTCFVSRSACCSSDRSHKEGRHGVCSSGHLLLLGLDLHVARRSGILIPELLLNAIEYLLECRDILSSVDALFDCVANVFHLFRKLRLVLHIESLASGDIALTCPATVSALNATTTSEKDLLLSAGCELSLKTRSFHIAGGLKDLFLCDKRPLRDLCPDDSELVISQVREIAYECLDIVGWCR
jgi:hypothetical protein